MRVGLHCCGEALGSLADGCEDSSCLGERAVARQHCWVVDEQVHRCDRIGLGGVDGVGERAQRARGQRAREAQRGERLVAAAQHGRAGATRLGERGRAQGVTAPHGGRWLGGHRGLLEQAAPTAGGDRVASRARGDAPPAHQVEADVGGVGAGGVAGVEVHAGDDCGCAELDDVSVGARGRSVPEAEAVHLEEEVDGGGRAAAHAAGGGPRTALQAVAEAGATGAEAGAADARVEAEAAAAAAGARNVGAGERQVAVDDAAAGVGEFTVLVGEAPGVLTLRDAAGAELGDLVAVEGELAGRGRRTRGLPFCRIQIPLLRPREGIAGLCQWL